ncbi:PREDICTED: polyprenol reductase [Trachymyrmex cornetzi]|uniref:Polyprenal reductase n=1 Tax=Trachymyrmex cornetzi TaxID=471704 RepID=A0A195E4H7_9HYME|nr:PREDICTED: polyprenol reductase [Trachymyrmex cornetzi]XP_018363010.1 PREDICTED: polyprenol reductase [Trachymyrmex cornetzi]XP_018363011.1 PREDICTED: polyprenol reductase [Trachymyrmex cornetzi]XP_018363012.1 PREDICTED: polyprenol reductase [Trachymyrmex cornetzi]KYN19981.1 putative polyprenol reductase [Trachymyrmex cornetzi]
MDTNIMRHFYIFTSMNIILISLSLSFLESYLPTLIKRAFLFGKFSVKTPHTIAAKFEVPKRWFRHFYIFCAPLMTITLCSLSYKYLYNGNIPEIVFTLLDTLLGTSRKQLISAEDAFLVIVLFNIHCWKRFYESCFISVYSNQKIHVALYFLGLAHYIGVILCILGESEGFVKGSHATLFLHKVTIVKLICASICLLASYEQLKTNFILAKLRKNSHGDVVSLEHKIPFNRLFKYIAGPLQLCEVIIYLMFSVILWRASTFHYVTFWVASNQMECAYLSHQWYRKTFTNYPKERKIIIPYIW